MADLSDVEVAFVNILIGALYPNGVGKACVLAAPVRVYRGLPQSGPLELDLVRGVANISVFTIPASGHNTTRWSPIVRVLPGTPTLTVEVSGGSASFAGVGGAGQVAGVLIDGRPFVYRLNAEDTPNLVAAVLVDLVRTERDCWLSGATLSVPGAIRLVARVTADGVTRTESARQSQNFRLSVWCPNPDIRDILCSLIDETLAINPFIVFADDSAGRLTYCSTSNFDENQDKQQYRRDLIYDVEYGTVTRATSPALIFGLLGLAGNSTYA